jgi:hypothetical protein
VPLHCWFRIIKPLTFVTPAICLLYAWPSPWAASSRIEGLSSGTAKTSKNGANQRSIVVVVGCETKTMHERWFRCDRCAAAAGWSRCTTFPRLNFPRRRVKVFLTHLKLDRFRKFWSQKIPHNLGNRMVPNLSYLVKSL